MKRIPLFFRNIIFFLPFFLFFSCTDPIPNIIVTSPQDGEEYFRDQDIEIKVILIDTKGKSFTVRLFIDDLIFNELSEAPYHFTIKAGKIKSGDHTIKICAEGVEVFRKIIIHKAASESPDFVTFTNGNIPPEWTVHNWTISQSDGFDDNFSIASALHGAHVKTVKTCNRLSFYLKGAATINFYLGETLWEVIDNNTENQNGPTLLEWKLYEFSFERKCYVFTWKLMSGLPINLDAIQFYND